MKSKKKRDRALQIYWEGGKSHLEHWETYLMSKSTGSGFWKPKGQGKGKIYILSTYNVFLHEILNCWHKLV